jgi:hypothetical protein
LETVTEVEQGVVGGNQGSFTLLCVGSSVLLSYTNQYPYERVFYCKGNLTILRRILHLDLAKGNHIDQGKTNTQHLPSQGKSKENALRIPG